MIGAKGPNQVWPAVNFPFTLAPMVGLSHVAMRSLLQDYMPQGAKTYWPTEMLNSRKLPSQEVGQTPETLRTLRDDFLVPQILGNELKYIAPTLEKLKSMNVAGIDINMGCPVSKALKHNYGVALMGDPEYAWKIVSETKSCSHVPVTVKLRAGIDFIDDPKKQEEYFFHFTDGLIKAGADLLCLHPRMAVQKRKGRADWEQIKKLKERSSVPIIGNGDVQIWEDAIRMLEETGCDGVMIGRALTARPWMLWQLGEELGLPAPEGRAGERAPRTPEEEALEYGRALKKLVSYCFEFFEESYAHKKIKFYLRVSHMWLNFGHGLTKKMGKCKSHEEYQWVLEEFFTQGSALAYTQYTQLTF
jgi:tRNA-dihydrouridine synthase B